MQSRLTDGTDVVPLKSVRQVARHADVVAIGIDFALEHIDDGLGHATRTVQIVGQLVAHRCCRISNTAGADLAVPANRAAVKLKKCERSAFAVASLDRDSRDRFGATAFACLWIRSPTWLAKPAEP
jgi:hypothetical protein